MRVICSRERAWLLLRSLQNLEVSFKNLKTENDDVLDELGEKIIASLQDTKKYIDNILNGSRPNSNGEEAFLGTPGLCIACDTRPRELSGFCWECARSKKSERLVMQRKNCRYTGTPIVIFDSFNPNSSLDGKKGRWVVVCEAHNSMTANRHLEEARTSAVYPEWCEECGNILKEEASKNENQKKSKADL